MLSIVGLDGVDDGLMEFNLGLWLIGKESVVLALFVVITVGQP